MEKRITISDLYAAKAAGRKIAVVTCYDYTMARLIAASSIDVVLVGDSAGEAVLGFENTLPVTMDFMTAITAAVRRGIDGGFVVGDMPFLSYQLGIPDAIKNAARLVIEGGADIVKIEADEAQLPVIEAITNAGLAVMAHIGIRPQTIALKGKLRAEGTTADAAAQLVKLAGRMVEAGSKMLLLEGTARETAAQITKQSPVPVIGCGSGVECDGQVLILPDILGLTSGGRPKFAKSFGNVGGTVLASLDAYAADVRAQVFPDDEHSYHLKSS
jgi:3-methyl-2-oxobutanoate hydroxymethyltransferase